MFSTLSPTWAVTIVSSELFLVIVRSRDISILAKNQSQRTDDEQSQVSRGLMRSLILELVLFVPASAILVLLIFPPLAAAKFSSAFVSRDAIVAFYTGLGIMSYGFPFAAFRRIVTRLALNTLKEFADLHTSDVAAVGIVMKPKKAKSVQD
jgi:hypothetical protein